MTLRTGATALTLAVAAASAAAAPMLIPLDVNGLAGEGQATVTHTEFDINDATRIFDDDRTSLARTPAKNPAFVRVIFPTQRTIHGLRVRFGPEPHDWKVTADGKVVARDTFRGESPQTVEFARPISAREFRLDVKRLEGDDYVHISDWELLQPGDVSDLTISPAPEGLMQDSVVRFTASVKTSDGRTLDVTRDAAWSSPTPGVEPWRQPNSFHVADVGPAIVRAAFNGLTASRPFTTTGYETKNTAFDLNTLYIERTPRIAFDENPETGGWPKPGQRVEWVAHLRNWGQRDVPEVGYQWVLDGKPVKTGTIRGWKAGAEAKAELPWDWEKKRHRLTFILDPEGRFVQDEYSRWNNQVGIDTDALAVGFWVEDGLNRYMRENQRQYGDGANSFEDWAQRQMNRWNQMFEQARYGTAPEGITERVRLDHVVHVPTGALPLDVGLPTNSPDRRDRTVDLMWGFQARDYDTFWEVLPARRFRPMHYEYGLIHELNHARYVVDAYGFDVAKSAVEDLKGLDGQPLLGTPAMPYTSGLVHDNKYRGMMDSTHYFSEHEAYAWNRAAGQRARYGNQNGTSRTGTYMKADLPEHNRVRFVDADGRPIANATVGIHQARPVKDTWYGKKYVQDPDLTFATDADGWVTLPKNPFGEPIVHGYGHANSVMLVTVKKGDTLRTLFVEATDWNLQHWRGFRDEAAYEATVDLSPDNPEIGTIRPLLGGGTGMDSENARSHRGIVPDAGTEGADRLFTGRFPD